MSAKKGAEEGSKSRASKTSTRPKKDIPTAVMFDTNILFRMMTQAVPGCELEHWEEIEARVEKNEITVLLPEVVLLELQKNIRWMAYDAKSYYEKALPEINKAIDSISWNELTHLKKYLKEHTKEGCHKWADAWKKKADRLADRIKNFTQKDSVRTIAFTREIMFDTERRMLNGTFKGRRDGESHADAYIIETLASYFSAIAENDRGQLLVCTENVKDFGLRLESGETVLHPCIKEGLPPAQLFINLKSLAEFIKDKRQVRELNDKEIEEALEQERKQEQAERLRAARHFFMKVPRTPQAALDQEALSTTIHNYSYGGDQTDATRDEHQIIRQWMLSQYDDLTQALKDQPPGKVIFYGTKPGQSSNKVSEVEDEPKDSTSE